MQLSILLWDSPDETFLDNSVTKNVHVSHSEQALRDFGCSYCMAKTDNFHHLASLFSVVVLFYFSYHGVNSGELYQ